MGDALRAVELIRRKRDGGELSDAELGALIGAYVRDEVPDSQIAAFCMAVYFRGLSPRETFGLTTAMVRSGESLDLSGALGRKVLDKHSTGGVGDKTSLVIGPIVAACGVPLGKMSGRGLGHTGGTLDKLESIPGYRSELSIEQFIAQLRTVGLAIISQSRELVPADKLLYSLRDRTATVEQLSLIASSIMSKKIAGGAQAIVLDVKVGDGAFMRTLDDARALAEAMLALGAHAGREVVCLLSDMDQPLGCAVGNALEVRETLATLRGRGPSDLTELAIAICVELLMLSDLGVDATEAAVRVEQVIADGSAEEAWWSWIGAQGGARDEQALPLAPVCIPLPAARAGTVTSLSATRVGDVALGLGAGRWRPDDPVDHAVGVVCLRKRGDQVERGESLAEIHARDPSAAERARDELAAAYTIGEQQTSPRRLLLDRLA